MQWWVRCDAEAYARPRSPGRLLWASRLGCGAKNSGSVASTARPRAGARRDAARMAKACSPSLWRLQGRARRLSTSTMTTKTPWSCVCPGCEYRTKSMTTTTQASVDSCAGGGSLQSAEASRTRRKTRRMQLEAAVVAAPCSNRRGVADTVKLPPRGHRPRQLAHTPRGGSTDEAVGSSRARWSPPSPPRCGCRARRLDRGCRRPTDRSAQNDGMGHDAWATAHPRLWVACRSTSSAGTA